MLEMLLVALATASPWGVFTSKLGLLSSSHSDVYPLCRYIGSLGSSQHLHTSVSILLALAQDSASPVVQCWAAHSLGLIADSGGPMFRDFVEVR